MNKYKLTKKSINYKGRTLYQIQALKDFTIFNTDIKKGDLGGYIEKEFNLSQYNYCWIGKHVKVLGNARVAGEALITGYVTMTGNSYCFGKLTVFGKCIISGKEVIHENDSITIVGLIFNFKKGLALQIKNKIEYRSY